MRALRHATSANLGGERGCLGAYSPLQLRPVRAARKSRLQRSHGASLCLGTEEAASDKTGSTSRYDCAGVTS